jgi:septal ring factor EnvC (AmiA/AmiB activator)
MAFPAPNFDRLSNAHLVMSEEAAKFANIPAFDQGVQILQAIERIEQRVEHIQQTQTQMQQTQTQLQQAQTQMQQAQTQMQQAQTQMQQTQTQIQQTQVEIQLSMQQMSDRFETRSKASYVLKLESLYVRSD